MSTFPKGTRETAKIARLESDLKVALAHNGVLKAALKLTKSKICSTLDPGSKTRAIISEALNWTPPPGREVAR